MMQGNLVRQATLVVMLATAWSLYFFGPFWCDPNAYMLGTEGDVMKNYFTFCWHVKYDPSCVQFTGMNYPFGDQINYPDAQPLWSGALRALSKAWPDAAEYAVGFENMLVLLGQPLTALFAFLLLIKLRVRPWLAVVCAIGAMALEPQTSRISGHFGLSYAYAFPLMVWLYMRARDHADLLRTSFWLSLVSLLLFWIHPYLGFVPWGFVVLLFLTDLALGWDRKERQRVVTMAVGLAIPIIIFLTVQRFTDHHLERTEHPLGYFEYQTTWSNLFWPYYGMASPLHASLFGPQGEQTYEGIAYLGMATMLLAPIAGMLALVSAVWRKRQTALPYDPVVLRMMIPAGLMLLFAMGFPFDLDLQALLWKIPWVSQFRSAGRFAWPAYWVLFFMAVTAANRIHGATARSLLRPIGWLCIALVVVLPLYEGFYHYKVLSSRMGTPPNLFREQGLSPRQRAWVGHARSMKGYSAIVPLPWYHIGSDEFFVVAPIESERRSMLLSWHTGLPIMANLLPKVSVSETRIMLNAMGPPWYSRSMAELLPPSTKFLVIAGTGELQHADRSIKDRSELVKDFGEVELRSLTADQLFSDQRPALFERALEQGVDTMSAEDETPAGAMLYRSYDRFPARHIRHGSGALELPDLHQVVLFTFPPNTLRQGGEYVATFWNHSRAPLASETLVTISEDDTVEHKVQWRGDMSLRGARTHDGDWCMMEFPFVITDSTHAHSLVLARCEWYSDTIWVDELLVRSKGQDVLSFGRSDTSRSELFYNGHWLDKP